MKILIIQEDGRNKENKHMRECHSLKHWFTELGVEHVECWGKGHKSFKTPFKEIEKDFDVLFCLENYDDGWMPDISKSKKFKVFWSIDSHMELKSHLEFCKNSNIQMHLNAQAPYVHHFKELADKCYWWPTAVDTRWFQPLKDVEKDIDLGFVGSIIGDRQIFADLLTKTVGLETFSGILGKDMVSLTNRFKVGFNKTISNDINMRIVETTACNVPLVTNMTPGLDKMYNLDSDLIVYNTPKEMIGACQWMIKDDAARKQVASNGYKRTLAGHTYKNRCAQVLNELKSI